MYTRKNLLINSNANVLFLLLYKNQLNKNKRVKDNRRKSLFT